MTFDPSNEDHQRRMFEMADGFIDEASMEGEPFTEALNNWAITKAIQEFE